MIRDQFSKKYYWPQNQKQGKQQEHEWGGCRRWRLIKSNLIKSDQNRLNPINFMWSMWAEPIKSDQINVIYVSRADESRQINVISVNCNWETHQTTQPEKGDVNQLKTRWSCKPPQSFLPLLPFYLTQSTIKSETGYFFRKVFLYNVKKEIYFRNNLSYLSHYYA